MSDSRTSPRQRSRVLFAETQRFDQPWLRRSLRLLVLVLALIPPAFFFLMEPEPPRLSERGYILGLVLSVIAFLVVAAVALLFQVSRLETVVRSEGVILRFVPFHAADKVFEKRAIERAQVVTYSPLTEYGGWGIRKGRGSRGWAYNVRGNKGLSLTLQGGERVLIGTQRPEELEEALRQM